VDPEGSEDLVYRLGVTGSAPMTEPPPVELLAPADLAAAVPYAYAATTRGRSLCVFTAGACPLDGSGSTVAAGDVVAQADQAMDNLRRALHAAGAQLDDVVKTTVYVASSDRSDLSAAWGVVHGHFGPHEPPSTLLGVSVLGYPDQLVEVEAIAALGG
jgi:enamine deaminase RidA (YjgF/YER057c/UK114 family)